MSETQRRIRVAHVLRRFSFEEWGGTETVVWNTVQKQRLRGINTDILCTSALSTTGEEIRDGIRIHRFPYWYPYIPMDAKTRLELDKKGGNPFAPSLFKALRQGNFDFFHIHCGGRMAVMCTKLAHSLGIPCVISLHGGFAAVPSGELKKMMSVTKGKFHYGGIIDRIMGYRKSVIAETDAVICISRKEEQLLKKQFPKQRIVYLPNGVNCEDFEQKPSCSPRQDWGIAPEKRLILCISRIDYQKNQKLLLELLKNDTGSHLLLIGPITAPWYHDELQEDAKKLNVSERLTVIPGLPPNDPRLKAILHEADVFILPSLHEPFGIVALEAWAAGIPVIAANVGGLKDFIVHEKNGLLFNPEDAGDLLKQYNILINNYDLRKRLAENARNDVQAYSWTALTDRLLALYGELLDAKR